MKTSKKKTIKKIHIEISYTKATNIFPQYRLSHNRSSSAENYCNSKNQNHNTHNAMPTRFQISANQFIYEVTQRLAQVYTSVHTLRNKKCTLFNTNSQSNEKKSIRYMGLQQSVKLSISNKHKQYQIRPSKTTTTDFSNRIYPCSR